MSRHSSFLGSGLADLDASLAGGPTGETPGEFASCPCAGPVGLVRVVQFQCPCRPASVLVGWVGSLAALLYQGRVGSLVQVPLVHRAAPQRGHVSSAAGSAASGSIGTSVIVRCAWLPPRAVSGLEGHCSGLPRQEISTPLFPLLSWLEADGAFGLIRSWPWPAALTGVALRERGGGGGGIDRPVLTDDLHQLWLGGMFAMGRWPGQARGVHLASRMIKLFVGPVCRGRPGCRFLVGAEHVRPPTPPRPRWPRGLARRLPRGLRASCSRHLQDGSCRVSRVL